MALQTVFQSEIGKGHPKMDFSQMPPVSLTDLIDALLDRAKACSEIIEANSLDGTTAFETVGHDAIAKLSWQVIENLEMAKKVNDALWSRYKQDTGFGQTTKGR